MGKLRKLFHYEQASGLLMIGALLLALAAANSPIAAYYQSLHHLPVHLRFGPLTIDRPLVQWINEGLMVFFFLLVGLEIKREFFEGHLSTLKSAALPAIAALGGMTVPAAIYVALNWRDPTSIHGWAIPTATDIVLALGLLSLLGARVPQGLKIFLTAVAIFDDIGAVLIIGLFYGEDLSAIPLYFAGLGVGMLVLLNVFRIGYAAPYIAVSLFLWVAMLKSGVEASLTGIIIAFAIPMRISRVRSFSPLRETERRLHAWSVLIVVPLFAFFNAGIVLEKEAIAILLTAVPLGIVAGLFIGKQVGVLCATLLAVRLGIAELPQGVTWSLIYGTAALAGIGFTMSLFVTSLAFSDPDVLVASKLAILLGSFLSAVLGVSVIFRSTGSGGLAKDNKPAS